jgi:hypothetical protein
MLEPVQAIADTTGSPVKFGGRQLRVPVEAAEADERLLSLEFDLRLRQIMIDETNIYSQE